MVPPITPTIALTAPPNRYHSPPLVAVTMTLPA